MAAGHGRRMQWRVTQRHPSASEVESLRSELSMTDIARSEASLAATQDVSVAARARLHPRQPCARCENQRWDKRLFGARIAPRVRLM